jgi:tetratricopeptide (TPR) repeat protein
MDNRDEDGGEGEAEAAFAINPEIPIPAEIPEGEQALNLEELSWEMILSGMLRVIVSGEETPERTDYYRRFVLTLRPAILAEFTEAAILKARNGGFDMALEILDTLCALFPASPVPRLNRALALEERAALFERRRSKEAKNGYLAAAAAYEEAMALNPPFPDAFFNGGFFYLGRKDFHRAKECFSFYAESGDDPEKKEQAETIIKEIRANCLEDECFREAFELIERGEEEAGMSSIRDFLERCPSVWNGWFMLGWALRRLGRWEDGVLSFRKAIELGGGGDTRNELAICLMETGDHAGARRELETALRDDPENVKIISNLGVLAMKTGSDDEAAAFFRTALELDPGDPVALQYCPKKRSAEP